MLSVGLLPDDLFDLSNKVGVVTGGNGGMGRRFAVALAASGADVVIVDTVLDGVDEIRQQIEAVGRKCIIEQVDVTKAPDVDQMMQRLGDQFPTLDILIHTVGQTFRKPALEMTIQEWEKVVTVNLTSVFITNVAAGRQMVKQKSGKIINIASVAAHFPYPDRSAYAASKAAIWSHSAKAVVRYPRSN